MTDLPYTDQDLRAEAARQHADLVEDCDFMGVGESMEDAAVPSLAPQDVDGQPADADGVTWGQLLNPDVDRGDAYNEAQRAIHELITGAADVSAWAVNIGADGFQPDDRVLELVNRHDSTVARIFLAFRPDVDDSGRDAIRARIHEALNPQQ